MAADGTSDDELMALVRTLAAGRTAIVLQMLDTRPPDQVLADRDRIPTPFVLL